ncbi:MAG TPA: hypothetical protein VEK57_17390 [Thermoanaerobaculia bacterium]|nr:hypothetical protein [Thermoanaerobaculia bacterium]
MKYDKPPKAAVRSADVPSAGPPTFGRQSLALKNRGHAPERRRRVGWSGGVPPADGVSP